MIGSLLINPLGHFSLIFCLPRCSLCYRVTISLAFSQLWRLRMPLIFLFALSPVQVCDGSSASILTSVDFQSDQPSDSIMRANPIVVQTRNVTKAVARGDCSIYGPTYDANSHTCLAPVCIVLVDGSCGPYCPGGTSPGVVANPSTNYVCGNSTSSPPTCPFNAGGCISYAFEGLFQNYPLLGAVASGVLDAIPDMTTCLNDVKVDEPLFNCLGDCRTGGGSDLQTGLCFVGCPISNAPPSCGRFFTDVIALPLGFLVSEDFAIVMLLIHGLKCLLSPCPS